jgi:hypothetical protein
MVFSFDLSSPPVDTCRPVVCLRHQTYQQSFQIYSCRLVRSWTELKPISYFKSSRIREETPHESYFGISER